MTIHKSLLMLLALALLGMMILSGGSTHAQNDLTYPLVDTGQVHCFNAMGAIRCGTAFNGQDAQYQGRQPAYIDNGDGTVTDLNTGLMWQQDPGPKVTYQEAMNRAQNLTLGGYDDWRLPSIKELYSLMDFSGVDASNATDPDAQIPFLDDAIFVFLYGTESGGARIIDSQWATSTVYNSTVMNGAPCFFGVNFADGRIKCYPMRAGGSGGYFALFVRGEPYGVNDFIDNGDGTISDAATGLTWMQADNGAGVIWGAALDFCENLSLAGADDWRLPDIKELHSIIDYSRSPDVTNSPALDPMFRATGITNEAGQPDFGFYWASTTLVQNPNRFGDATYISFGRSMGYIENQGGWIDVHGAGSQRSDAKLGPDPNAELGRGPQGDARRSDNLVRCVRGGAVQRVDGADPSTLVMPTGGVAAPDQGQGPGGQAPNGNNGNGQPPGNQPPQSGPPPEAFSACDNLSDGAACTVNTPNGTINGVCRPLQNDLACVPG